MKMVTLNGEMYDGEVFKPFSTEKRNLATERIVTEADLPAWRNAMVDDYDSYWAKGYGDVVFYYWVDGQDRKTLGVIADRKGGLYLSYEEYTPHFRTLDSCFSLYDDKALSEVLTVSDDFFVSKGLFLPAELAWKGIEHFVKTGMPSPEIVWITADDLPLDGNWA